MLLPSDVDPSELKNAILPGTFLPHVLYTALALLSMKPFAVITPTKTKFFCEFCGVSSGLSFIISKGAGK